MENVSFNLNDNVLNLSLHGQIDSANAADVEKALQTVRTAHPASQTILDCDDLSYISSAGLRVILRLKKAVPDIRLINVNSEIYEVFDMTGFTELMDIQKAYRRLSVEGCEVIGRGANGMVYRIDRDTIVKQYFSPDALPEIKRERELARTAFVLGVPTAIPYDVVRIEGGGYGSVFELLNAQSYSQLLSSGEKTVDETVRMSTELLQLIHHTVVKPGSMPSMKQTALKWASFLKDHLPKELFEKLYGLIDAVPEDYHMIHGDYHIKNVMLQNGESLLIDMDTLCHGHPIFELASMYNAYCGYSELVPSRSQQFLGISHEMAAEFWKKSLRLYLDGAPEETVRSVEEKAMIVGYTRILRRDIRHHEAQEEIDCCIQHLAELLPRTDTLLF